MQIEILFLELIIGDGQNLKPKQKQKKKLSQVPLKEA
jgi:hypothetical protein